jgi:sensor histidine kinase YesM
MHPILGQLRRLALYLVAWIPLAAMLAYLMAVTGGISKSEAIAISFPLCLLYAFVCLSAWYSCRATPFDRSTISKLLEVHVAAALVASGLWILAAEAFAQLLVETTPFQGLAARLPRTIPLLLGMGVLFYLLSAAFYYVILAVEAAREAEERVLKASVFARDAELRALKAQVNPHFLFNSLNSISALTSSDPPKVREMCILLGDFLRRTLGLGEKPAIPLSEEMPLIRAFLAVEKIRFGPRIKMEEKIDQEAMDILLPPVLLQALVENAVAHGIANLVEGGWIRLDARCKDDSLFIVVENSYDPEAPRRCRNGVGLVNVRQRLQTRYENRATLAVKVDEGRFRVAIKLPAEREVRTT